MFSISRTGLTLAISLVAGTFSQARAIGINVANPDELLAAFATANANPQNFYDIWLAFRQDAQGNPIPWKPSRSFVLTKGRVYVHGSNTHNYPERYVFDGQNQRRLFSVEAAAGATPVLYLEGVTLQNGNAGSTQAGGGVYSRGGNLYLYYTVVKNNTSNVNGSGVRIDGGFFEFNHVLIDGNVNDQYTNCGGGATSGGGGMSIAGTVQGSINNSTFSNNKACRGGGLEVAGTTNLTLWNCTFSNNLAKKRGGGLFFNGGSGTTTFHFTTIAYNKAGVDPIQMPGEKNYGGGLAMWGFNGKINMYGTLLAKNTVVNNMKPWLFYTTNDCYWDGGQFTGGNKLQNNIVGEIANCSQFGSSNWWGIGWDGQPFDPKLSSVLQTWGSSSGFALPVHMPLSDSPAKGNYFETDPVWAPCEPADERSFTRPFANDPARPRCDIGSVEASGTP